jgi:hypothetical protein
LDLEAGSFKLRASCTNTRIITITKGVFETNAEASTTKPINKLIFNDGLVFACRSA